MRSAALLGSLALASAFVLAACISDPTFQLASEDRDGGAPAETDDADVTASQGTAAANPTSAPAKPPAAAPATPPAPAKANNGKGKGKGSGKGDEDG